MTFSPPSNWTRSTACDYAAVMVLFVVATIVALTFRDFGLGWDDFTHAQYGELLIAYYRSGFTDHRAFSFVNLEMYGGGFDMLADLVAKVLPQNLFETRRLIGGLVGVLGLTVTWRLARRIGGPAAGLVAVVLLASCPMFFGHLMINAKDGPFAVAMVILLLGMVHVLSEYPRPRAADIALFGLGLGLSFGSRTLGALAGFDMLAALALLVGVEAAAKGWREAARRAARFIGWLLPGGVLAYVIMAVIWPWSVQDPLNPLRALIYFSDFFEYPWRELFGGELILVPDMPRRYVPTLFALRMPEIFLALAVPGAVGALYAAARRDLPLRQRAIYLCVVTAALFPIALTVALRPAMYNGIRHFMFVVPPLAVLGGLAGAWLLNRIGEHRRYGRAAAVAAFAIGVTLPVIEAVRLHPYQYTYYNHFIGGVAGASGRYMLDYWGLALKQASQGLAQWLATEKVQKPADRQWQLGVCGPHPAARVELGPDFHMTWDARGVDFAIQLGVFYCRQFADAPVIAEIRREGVLYAKVYDLRGRSYLTLFNPYPGQPETEKE